MKKLFSAASIVLAGVDLAGPQAGDQRLGSEVDQDHLVGLAQHRVGDRLPHPRPGQLGDLVVERLQVLDVDGREDVDPGGEHVAHVFVALLVLDAGRVGVGQLVDQRQLGRAGQQRRQVHLLEVGVAVGDAAPRNRLQALGQGRGLRPLVGLHVADRHVAPGLLLGMSLLQHPVGLADPGRHADEDLEVSSSSGAHRPILLRRLRGGQGSGPEDVVDHEVDQP